MSKKKQLQTTPRESESATASESRTLPADPAAPGGGTTTEDPQRAKRFLFLVFVLPIVILIVLGFLLR
jgi:hypothetical protein